MAMAAAAAKEDDPRRAKAIKARATTTRVIYMLLGELAGTPTPLAAGREEGRVQRGEAEGSREGRRLRDEAKVCVGFGSTLNSLFVGSSLLLIRCSLKIKKPINS
jgi:hypothetical protein